jgi:hypothetical protein
MLKKYMVLRAPDVNTEVASSEASDVKGEESSTQEKDVKEQSEEEIVKSLSQEKADDKTKDVDAEASADTGEEEQADDQQNSQQEEEQEQETKTEEAVPYTRFTEVNAKKVELEQQYESVKPLVEQARTLNEVLSTNQIPPQEFQAALQYMIALRKDPAAAYAMLKPTYEQLAQMVGDILPEDLQAKVAAATLSVEDAQEIARGRGQQHYSQVQKQWQQHGQQQNIGNVINQATQLWVSSKQQNDPDLKPGSDLWNQVDLNLKSLTPPQDAMQAQQNCETAYKNAKALFAKFQPRQAAPAKRSPSSKGIVGNNGNAVLKTPMDALNAVKAGLRPNQVRYN